MNGFVLNLRLFPRNFGIFQKIYSRYHSLWKFKPFYETFLKYPDNIAVIDSHGSFSYKDILYSSFLLAEKIKKIFPNSQNEGERISFLCSNDATYVSVLLSCWISGNVAVPLCSSHPQSLLEYYVKDSKSKLIISNTEFLDQMQPIASNMKTHFVSINHDIYKVPQEKSFQLSQTDIFSWSSNLSPKRALIIYTSGTTGLPKGVVLTHENLHNQISAVVESWKISPEDSILHALPLHHIHGIMNALLCILSVGGTVVMQKKFDVLEAWKYFLCMDSTKPRVNLFFAVPTMYAKLVESYESLGKNKTYTNKKCVDNMRLMSSGSMALPVPIFQRWEEMTGHKLLERFGMSEIGMALSNPLNGFRIPGFVGTPLPGVEVKIRKYESTSENTYFDIVSSNSETTNVLPENEGQAGDLLIKGPNVFKEYWKREKATLETFAENSWFITGDTACFENGSFKILGRTSVDIIKSGGYKISALEVESCLLRHPNILECTVFGIDDNVWGERVAALIKFQAGKNLNDEDVKLFCKKYLPKYALPTVIKHVNSIPRNVMGKVNKKELRNMHL